MRSTLLRVKTIGNVYAYRELLHYYFFFLVFEMKSLLFIITYYAFMFSKDKKIICSENHAIVHEVQK